MLPEGYLENWDAQLPYYTVILVDLQLLYGSKLVFMADESASVNIRVMACVN